MRRAVNPADAPPSKPRTDCDALASRKGDQMRNIRRVSVALCAFAFTVFATSGARADAPGDAWAAARGMLPASPYVVMGLNISTIKSSAIFQQLYPKLLAQAGEAQKGLDTVNKDCGINVTETIQGIVVAIDESQKGIILVSTKGLDQAKISDCLGKVAAKEKKQISASKPDAIGIVEYTAKGEKDKLYIAYLPKGVMAMSTEPTDKGLLQKWLGGKGVEARSAAGAALGKVNTNAAMWGVVAKAEQLEPGMNMKAGYGSADITGGNIIADLRLVLASAKEATEAVVKANSQLEEAKKGGQVPPALANVIKTLKITSAGEELHIKASMAEKEALGLIGMAMGGGQ
jgi:hypothetical protein